MASYMMFPASEHDEEEDYTVKKEKWPGNPPRTRLTPCGYFDGHDKAFAYLLMTQFESNKSMTDCSTMMTQDGRSIETSQGGSSDGNTSEAGRKEALIEEHQAPCKPVDSSVPSLGSIGHACGSCKPCAHSWKPGGCSKGESCTYCHLCTREDFLDYQSLKKAWQKSCLRPGSKKFRQAHGVADEGDDKEFQPGPHTIYL